MVLTACSGETAQDPAGTVEQTPSPSSTGTPISEIVDEQNKDNAQRDGETDQEDESEYGETIPLLSQEEATAAYETMAERFNNESPVDVYDDVLALLPKMPEPQAGMLFAAFDSYMETWSMNYTDQIYFEEGPMFRLYESIGRAYDYEDDSYHMELVTNETHKAILESLLNSGFKFIWLEGSPYPFFDYSQLRVLEGSVSGEISSYVSVMATETEDITAADAAIMVSWDELARRIVETEKAIGVIKTESLSQRLMPLYQFYTNAYLMGIDNTPIVSWETNAVLDEVRESYALTLSRYPNTQLSLIVSNQLELLESLNYVVPYNDQTKFQSIIEEQSLWVDEAVAALQNSETDQ